MVHERQSWVQIEAFIHSRLKGREIRLRLLLGPPPQESINSITQHELTLFEKLRKTKCQLRVHPLRYQVKEFCVLFSLLTGW